ncbi:MAG: pirin family protein [Pseudomonadota bacterium]|nr:pirin family protein [Pseudomonadota bacterium]
MLRMNPATTEESVINIRKSESRGVIDFGWLKSGHTFSFCSSCDPRFSAFSALRIINDDRIEVRSGFDTHGHQHMQIISYVKTGALAHKDSMGNVETIPTGDVQWISAGTGVLHSEFNLTDVETNFFQIWVLPRTDYIELSCEERPVSAMATNNYLIPLASPDGLDDSLSINQDVLLYKINPGQLPTRIKLDPHRCKFVQVVERMCSSTDKYFRQKTWCTLKMNVRSLSVAWEVSFSISIYRDTVLRDLL